jgi:hypothetical protein
MLDVHAPHETVHSWRDFFTHIATITIGLLIALALEAGIEGMHHRHIVREARENIREELRENQQLLAVDLKYLGSNSDTLRQDITLLTQLKRPPQTVSIPADPLSVALEFTLCRRLGYCPRHRRAHPHVLR